MENIQKKKKERNLCEISLLVYIQVFGSGYFYLYVSDTNGNIHNSCWFTFFPAKHSWTAKVASYMTKPILGKKNVAF